MNTQIPLPLLGGLTPALFMERYWQKKPLLIRAAVPGFAPLLDRAELFDLAGSDDVESRLVVQPAAGHQWSFQRGPFKRRALPPLKQRAWTVLVQGVDLHDTRVHDLMGQFRFVPDARLDDLMISWASDGGGVGPHYDNYDVFLLQAFGRRRWRIGRQKDKSLVPDMPLKILAHFAPEQEFVLEPGDMLYLPPHWAHDGIAEGECMTYSIGFKSPNQGELARELLERLADQAGEALEESIYRDPGQPAVETPAQLPTGLVAFATQAVQDILRDPQALQRALGEYLSEPKANVWFEEGQDWVPGALHLDRRTRMMYDARHVYINGESFRSGGRDAKLMQRLADQRHLTARDAALLSPQASALVAQWCEAGWLYVVE